MLRARVYWILLGGLVLLAATSALVAVYSPAPNTDFKDAASVLLVAGSVSVGIERTIEGFWTVIGELKNEYWPLSLPDQALEVITGDLNKSIATFFRQANNEIQQAAAAGTKTAIEASAAQTQLATIRRRLSEIQLGAVGNKQAAAVAAVAAKEIVALQNQFEQLGPAAKAARETINAFGEFAASFNDNPGRRIISLFAGAVIGLGIAGVSGMDIIHAAAGTIAGGSLRWGVVITGIVLGLGSAPTHEVIRSIQEYKQTQKTANA